MPCNPQTLQRRDFFGWLVRSSAAVSGMGVWAGAQAAAVPDVLLAKNAPKDINPAGYLVSEKYDGVRALWDGQVLRFRSGRTVAAPAWFTSRLPALAMDGELWLARGKFDELSGIVRKAEPVDAEWQRVQYMVFEAPQSEGPFSQRLLTLQEAVRSSHWDPLNAVEQTSLPNAAALQARLKAVTAAGGEGLMLHLASAPVTSGRSDWLLKLKPMQDAEAVVLAHIAGKGKFADMLGALEVQLESGQRLRLGTGFSDAQRRNPPAIGSTVTFAYRDLTPSGKPRFASFLREFRD